MICYALVFSAMIPGVGMPQIWLNDGIYNDTLECERHLESKALDAGSNLEIKNTPKGKVALYSGTDGETYSQCVQFSVNAETVCSPGVFERVFGVVSNCDCTRLNVSPEDNSK